jgi:ADP-ribose pyrophosphatase YjhB (NUDIX family)
MYKIFVNEKPLFLTNTIEKETNFKVFLLETANVEQIIVKLFQNKFEKVYLYHPDEKELFRWFKQQLPVVKAAGGLVKNKNNEILFIYKGGKWDLPKGGIDKNETPEETAIREVEEETGVQNLEIIRKLQKTYHIFKHNNEYKLKITYWFEMQTNYHGALIPQENEGIEKVAWITKDKINQLLNNTYENIKSFF